MTTEQICTAIKKHLLDIGVSQKEAGEKMGMSQGAVANQLCNRTFGTNAAIKWNKAFGFRVNWLRTGEGPMFDNAPVQNNVAGGDMIINSPGASTSSSEGDVRVYKDLYEKAQAENLSLRAKLYKLMDRLTQNGLDCECD